MARNEGWKLYFQKVTHLFGRTRVLEAQTDEFLDKVIEGGMAFSRAVRCYLDEGVSERFEEFVEQAKEIEHRNDELRRSIETELYARTLIPDLRADVLALLEAADHLVNMYKGHLFRMSIQRPDIPVEFHKLFLELAEAVVVCVDSVALAARAFFRDMESVRDHCSKTMFLETETDKISTRLQEAVFSSDLSLDKKMHIRYFVERIDDVANKAEDLADSLLIYSIKRRI